MRVHGQAGLRFAPSIEAKLRGVKTGMRLDEAIRLCPDLIPIETHPTRYREYHVKIIAVLKRFADDVVPKSIDEAVVNLTNYQLVYKDMQKVAHDIKRAIRQDVGDYLRCSVGIAPNVFLAKSASDVQKPDGLTVITPDTIDDVLRSLRLTDLPGIGEGMAARLQAGGIHTPLALRYASPEHLRATCKSIVGWHWRLRLNFGGEMVGYQQRIQEHVGHAHHVDRATQHLRTLRRTTAVVVPDARTPNSPAGGVLPGDVVFVPVSQRENL